MNDPGDLSRVPCEIGRKPSRDEEIDRLSVADGQIEKTPRCRLRQELRFRLRAKWQRDSLDVVTAAPKLLDQRRDMQLGSALNKRDLGLGHDDALDGGGSQRA
jgi:hypothetical protein